jgi:hypothetical protein
MKRYFLFPSSIPHGALMGVVSLWLTLRASNCCTYAVLTREVANMTTRTLIGPNLHVLVVRLFNALLITG